MSKEKQIIEEMAKDLCQNTLCNLEEWNKCKLKVGEYCARCKCLAERLVNAGYRKQSEGEWIDADPEGYLYRFTCSLCGKTKLGKGTPYCPHCGAKMKGGE